MNAPNLLLEGWSFNVVPLVGCAVAVLLYVRAFGRRGRWGYFAAAIGLVIFTLCSPLATIASGVLFSAHMTQHILLLLIIPALLLLGLPRDFGSRLPRSPWLAAFGWAAGVGSMWFWHVPSLCDAAATSSSVHGLQTGSLLAMGILFWWPILAPGDQQRLIPGLGIAYLFTACIACTALGIILTLTPVEVCPVFRAPLTGSSWAFLRDRVSAERDRQIGGLLMWIPMCLVYVSAIMLELGRWLGAPAKPQLRHR